MWPDFKCHLIFRTNVHLGTKILSSLCFKNKFEFYFLSKFWQEDDIKFALKYYM